MFNFNHNKIFKYSFLGLFLAVETVLFILLQTVSGRLFSFLSLSSVVLCFVCSIIFFKRDTFHILSLIALFTTSIADLFLGGLLDFPFIRELAVCFFLITQTCYFLRIYSEQKFTTEKRWHILLRIIFPIIIIIATILVVKENTNFLALITMVYFSYLILNIIFSITQIKSHPLFFIGLILFMCCDICVGFSVLEEFLTIPADSIINQINNSQINFIWLFYLPSQTLIATDIIIKKD